MTTIGKPTPAHFVWKCTNCKRESSAKFEPGSKITPYRPDSGDKFVGVLVIECRGLEFTGFKPEVRYLSAFLPVTLTRVKGHWTCKGIESGTIFSEIDLQGGEWADYDEKVNLQLYRSINSNGLQASLPVAILNIESKWDRA